MPRLPDPAYKGVSIVLHRSDCDRVEVFNFAEPEEVRLDRLLEFGTGRMDVSLELTGVASESRFEIPVRPRRSSTDPEGVARD